MPQGLDPAFFKFPTDLIKSVPTPPGDGSTITAITYLTLAPPPPMESNAAWQAVNKAINATLQMDQVTAADYPAKVNVVISGNDLPDYIYNPTTNVPWGVISGLPAFVKAKCTDLTPYLSGDAIKDYPNLAHYTNYTWRSGVVDGKIYAMPIARPPIGTVLMHRPDLFEKAGIQMDKAPKDADDFKRMLHGRHPAAGQPVGHRRQFDRPISRLTPEQRVLRDFPRAQQLEAGRQRQTDQGRRDRRVQGRRRLCARPVASRASGIPIRPPTRGAFNDDFMAGRFVVRPWRVGPVRPVVGHRGGAHSVGQAVPDAPVRALTAASPTTRPAPASSA